MNAESIYPALPIPLQNMAGSFAGWQRARARFSRCFHRLLGEWMETGSALPLWYTADAIEVRVVPRPAFGSGSKQGLLKEIRLRSGDRIRIDVTLVDEIPRGSNDEFRAVESKVERNKG